MANLNGVGRRSAFGLGLLVFVVGACLMCVEIIGAMTIAPYFGSNVYVWGSVIAVFMGALSLGYALGGKLADRNPGPGVLSVLMLAAGVLVALAPVIGPPVCRTLLRADLGTALNPLLPLVAVALIYFLPSMLLGMIAPIAVRIASTALSSVGRVVGRLYALNTLGSVAGALVSTFVFAIVFGNRSILFGCGAVLALVGAVCFRLNRGMAGAGAAAEKRAAGGETKPVPGLRPLVFGCGVVLMGLQVIGGAQIAPYFGSSVFVWGSVITVFLGALALGYWGGGKLADRWPSMMALATVVVAAGIATLLIPLIAPLVCEAFAGLALGAGLNVLRPLFASAVLYFVPIGLFAMVAPFAVRLSTGRIGAVGGVAGRLYALSTLGNMVGVLLTTFVLISAIGKTHLLELGGLGVVVVAVAAVFLNNRATEGKRQPVLVSALMIIAVVALALVSKPSLVPLLSEDERSVGRVAATDGGDWHLIEIGQYEYGGDHDKYMTYHFLRRVRAERESPYHHIAVIEEATIDEAVLGKTVFKEGAVTTRDGRKIPVTPTPPRQGHSCRDLKFDQYVESSVLLDDKARGIRAPYTSGTTYSDMLHLPFLFSRRLRDVLIVGGGGGVVPMMFKKHYADQKISIDVVEIDPVVFDVAQKWFGLQTDENLRVHVQDGRMFVHNSRDTYDLIVLDAYTAGGRIPFHLTTREFLTEVRDHLRPGGVVLMNVISAVEGRQSALFRAEYRTFRAVFGTEHVYVFPKISYAGGPNAGTSTNVMLIATGPDHRTRLRRDEVVKRARDGIARNELKIASLVEYAGKMLSKEQLAEIPQHDVPVLTDDYAPVDFMVVDLDD